MRMPTPDAAVIARRAEIAAALRRIVPGEGVILEEDERRAYESDGLTAYHQPPLLAVLPSDTAQVSQVLRYCHEQGVKVVPRGAGTSLSGGALPLGRRHHPRPRQVQPRARDRLRQSLRRGAARRHQSRHLARRAACGVLLRARSLEPDRLHHRRQRRGEFRRRALPQIRPHHQQPARHRDGADERRGRAARRQASRCRGLRSPRHHDRLRRAARGRHRGHRAHPEEADHGARAAHRLSQQRERRPIASRRSSPPASSPAAWR